MIRLWEFISVLENNLDVSEIWSPLAIVTNRWAGNEFPRTQARNDYDYLNNRVDYGNDHL